MHRHGSPKVVIAVLTVVSALWGQVQRQVVPAATPVTGESWLNHLHRSFDETSMGKTGRLGPPEEEVADRAVELVSVDEKVQVTVSGADLYRWNCRGCHGESGLGAPPEINSVINPVRSSSAALVMERMKTVGMDMSPADARKLAKQSHDAILERLHHGGQDMPAFPQLGEDEIPSLIAYLRQLANVPHAQQIAINESPERVGEQIVKSTCHICHNALGPNPGPWQLAQGTIPPLSTLTNRVSKTRFIQKVTRGAPIVMGNPAIICRGRMPVFDYLSEEEAADAYLYLTRLPPYEPTIQVPTTMIAEMGGVLPPSDPPQPIVKASLLNQSNAKQIGERADMQLLALMTVAGVLVSVLLGGALAFTIWECMRLRGTKTEAKAWHEAEAQVSPAIMNRAQDRLSA